MRSGEEQRGFKPENFGYSQNQKPDIANQVKELICAKGLSPEVKDFLKKKGIDADTWEKIEKARSLGYGEERIHRALIEDGYRPEDYVFGQ